MTTFGLWLNQTSMTSFRSFVLVIVTAIVLVFFSILAAVMLMHDAPMTLIMSKDAAIRAAAQTTESSHHNFGYQIVTAVLQLIGVALGINAASAFGDRATSKELHEAKERGKITGAAAAAVMQEKVVTKEHPAPTVRMENVENATINEGDV